MSTSWHELEEPAMSPAGEPGSGRFASRNAPREAASPATRAWGPSAIPPRESSNPGLAWLPRRRAGSLPGGFHPLRLPGRSASPGYVPTWIPLRHLVAWEVGPRGEPRAQGLDESPATEFGNRHDREFQSLGLMNRHQANVGAFFLGCGRELLARGLIQETA